MSNSNLNLILDKEISDVQSDAFGHIVYSEMLSEIIEKNRAPYSIGLLGPWGVGKSTVKSLYEGLKHGDSKTKIINFNAWKYGGQEKDIKKALILHVAGELSGNKAKFYEETMTNLYSKRVEKITEFAGLKKILKSTWGYLCASIVILLVAVGLYKVSLAILQIQILSQFIGAVPVAISFIILNAANKIISAELDISVMDNYKRTDYPANDDGQLEYLLKKKVIAPFMSKYKEYERVVIFVDDMDRLSPQQMVDGIDAIRVFMDIKTSKIDPNSKFQGFVFVISCDEERIARALDDKRYRRDTSTDIPGGLDNIQDARDYLDRIFQFRVELTPIPIHNLRSYASDIIESNSIAIINEIEKSGTTVNNVLTRLIHTSVSSPRNVIQLINAFLRSYKIALKRESEDYTKKGKIKSNLITGNPEFLALVCGLRISFVNFYKQLVIEPTLLKEIFRLFVDKSRKNISKTEFESLPEAIRTQLSRILTFENEKYFVRNDCRELFTYLSANGGIKFPKSVSAFVLLAQSDLELELNDYPGLVNAMRNADSDEVLIGLGETINSSSSLESLSLEALRRVIDSIVSNSESVIVKRNVCRVIFDISNRIVIDESDLRRSNNIHQIVLFLCKQILNDNGLERYINFQSLTALRKTMEFELMERTGYHILHNIFTDPVVFTSFVKEHQLSNKADSIIEYLVDVSSVSTDFGYDFKTEFLSIIKTEVSADFDTIKSSSIALLFDSIDDVGELMANAFEEEHMVIYHWLKTASGESNSSVKGCKITVNNALIYGRIFELSINYPNRKHLDSLPNILTYSFSRSLFDEYVVLTDEMFESYIRSDSEISEKQVKSRISYLYSIYNREFTLSSAKSFIDYLFDNELLEELKNILEKNLGDSLFDYYAKKYFEKINAQNGKHDDELVKLILNNFQSLSKETYVEVFKIYNFIAWNNVANFNQFQPLLHLIFSLLPKNVLFSNQNTGTLSTRIQEINNSNATNISNSITHKSELMNEICVDGLCSMPNVQKAIYNMLMHNIYTNKPEDFENVLSKLSSVWEVDLQGGYNTLAVKDRAMTIMEQTSNQEVKDSILMSVASILLNSGQTLSDYDNVFKKIVEMWPRRILDVTEMFSSEAINLEKYSQDVRQLVTMNKFHEFSDTEIESVITVIDEKLGADYLYECIQKLVKIKSFKFISKVLELCEYEKDKLRKLLSLSVMSDSKAVVSTVKMLVKMININELTGDEVISVLTFSISNSYLDFAEDVLKNIWTLDDRISRANKVSTRRIESLIELYRINQSSRNLSIILEVFSFIGARNFMKTEKIYTIKDMDKRHKNLFRQKFKKNRSSELKILIKDIGKLVDLDNL